MELWRRVRWGMAALVAVLVGGTVGYVLLDFTLLEALYQTVITVFGVGFEEVNDLGPGGQAFTIALILVGVGAVLYSFTMLLESLLEAQGRDIFGRRRMERQIATLRDHVIVCGWGRVGSTLARYVAGAGKELVVIDRDPARLEGLPHPHIVGDATDEEVLLEAGIERARTLVASLTTDADNLYVTLTGRSLRPDLFVLARARVQASEAKLLQAGADRVVNPQHIGGARMAAFVLQPHVAEFLDVVMHDGSLEFRLEEIEVAKGSALAGLTVRQAHIRDQTGSLILALRDADGTFNTNPNPESVMEPGQVMIAIGTKSQLAALVDAARPQP